MLALGNQRPKVDWKSRQEHDGEQRDEAVLDRQKAAFRAISFSTLVTHLG